MKHKKTEKIIMRALKGHLISECLFDIANFPKNHILYSRAEICQIFRCFLENLIYQKDRTVL